MSDEKYTVTPIKIASKHQINLKDKSNEPNKVKTKKFDIEFNGRKQIIEVENDTGNVIIDGKSFDVNVLLDDDGYYIANVEKNHNYKIEYNKGDIYLEGRLIDFNFTPTMPTLNRRKQNLKGENIVKAPLPGVVTEILVKLNQEVSSGDTLCILEAMKMQNAIVAENGGKITEIFIKQGDNVSTNQDLIKIKNEG